MRTKARAIELNHGERIIAVVPERRSGPGWSNAPAWVYIATNDGRLRQECIQPEERTHELNILFSAGEVMCRALIESIQTTHQNLEQKE